MCEDDEDDPQGGGSDAQDAPDLDLSDADASNGDSDTDEEPLKQVGDRNWSETVTWNDWEALDAAEDDVCDEQPGLRAIPRNACDLDPHHFFLLLFPQTLFNHITMETNRYYHQWKRANLGDGVSSARTWVNCTLGEILCWFGMVQLMACFPLPQTKYYFNGMRSKFVGMPKMTDIMSQNRWEQIKRFLHLANNRLAKARDHPQFDRLFHVRKILTKLNQTFSEHYQLGAHVSVDESIVPFKGRTHMKQYCKDKPHKWGVKIWCLCCADTGYFYSFAPYAGKGSLEHKFGLCTDSVLALVTLAGIEGTKRVVYTDRWFTSPLLLVELERRGLFGCGTVMGNRKGMPKGPQTLGKERGSMIRLVGKAGGVGVKLYYCNWMDKRPVQFLSNVYGLGTTQIGRKEPNGDKNDYPGPRNGKQYQKYMGGVDVGDQLKFQYGTETKYKATKPWHKLLFGLWDMAMTNAWILYKKTLAGDDERGMLSHWEFLVRVSEGLVDMGLGERAEAALGTRGPGSHETEKMAKPYRCVHCSHLGRVRRTRTRCKDCAVHLCSVNCHKGFHESIYKLNKRFSKPGSLLGKKRRHKV